MPRRNKPIVDTYYDEVRISEASTWAHDYDTTLPPRGLARLRRRIKGRKVKHGYRR